MLSGIKLLKPRIGFRQLYSRREEGLYNSALINRTSHAIGVFDSQKDMLTYMNMLIIDLWFIHINFKWQSNKRMGN